MNENEKKILSQIIANQTDQLVRQIETCFGDSGKKWSDGISEEGKNEIRGLLKALISQMGSRPIIGDQNDPGTANGKTNKISCVQCPHCDCWLKITEYP